MHTWRSLAVEALVGVAVSAAAAAADPPATDTADEPPPRSAWVSPVAVVRPAAAEPVVAEPMPATDVTLYPWHRVRFEVDGGGVAGLAQVGGHTANDSGGVTFHAGLRDGRLRLVADCTLVELEERRSVMASDGTELLGYRDDGSSARLGVDVRYAISRTTTPHVDELYPRRTYETNADVWLGAGIAREWLSFEGTSGRRTAGVFEFGMTRERVYATSHYGFDFGVQVSVAGSPPDLMPAGVVAGGGVDLSLLFVSMFRFGN
jgi:hypothetical protein